MTDSYRKPLPPLGVERISWIALEPQGRQWLQGGECGPVHLVRGSWGVRPLRRPPGLAEVGLSGGELLGFGAERWGTFRQPVFLWRTGGKHLPLEVGWQRMNGPRHRTVLAFGELVRRMHDQGIDCRSWSDALEVAWGGCSRFSLRDPSHLSFRRTSLSIRTRISSLARLLAEFWDCSSLQQRLRFLRAYGLPLLLERRSLAAMVREGVRRKKGEWRRSALRTLRDRPGFFRLRRYGFRIHGVNSAEGWRAYHTLLPDPDVHWAAARIYKPGTRTHAGALEIGGKTYFLKRFNDRGWWYRLRHLGRRSRAVRCWLASWHFLQRGLPVPPPVLCLEERRFGILRRSYLLTEFVGDAVRLRQAWPEMGRNRRRALLSALGAMVGRMHLTGCVHGDLKWDNLLLAGAGAERVAMIDLDGSSWGWRSGRAARKDVDRFLRDLGRFGRNDHDQRPFLNRWRKWTSTL